MGSTSKLDAIYVLRASLGLLHEWIQTTFYAFLEEWFGCAGERAEPQVGV